MALTDENSTSDSSGTCAAAASSVATAVPDPADGDAVQTDEAADEAQDHVLAQHAAHREQPREVRLVAARDAREVRDARPQAAAIERAGKLFFLGGRGSSTTYHEHSNAYNALVAGSK